MKRILLLILVAALYSGIATAQNANRSGFFMELGIGGLIGNTPRCSYGVKDNVLYYKCLAGVSGDFGFGGRLRIGNHWTYELKAEAQIPFANPGGSFVGRILPIGFRYTSVEFYRNYSLYSHINLGGAIIVNRGIIYNENPFYPNVEETKLGFIDSDCVGYGIAYSAGIGINITTHFYAECAFNGQAIFNSFHNNNPRINNYGVVGVITGYRF